MSGFVVELIKSHNDFNFLFKIFQPDCSEFNTFFRGDDRYHDADLCVDIDTQHHFLNMDPHDHNASIDRELVMVLFIMCLVAALLGIVTFTHYVIERENPVKQRMRKAMSEYWRRSKASHGTNNNTNNNTNLNSAAGSHNSLTNKQHGSGPMITVTDCSSTKNLAASSSKIHEESRETDPLLLSASGSDLSGGSHVHSGFTPVFSGPNKVKFHVGETIIEESLTSSPNSSQIKLTGDASSNNEVAGDTTSAANNNEDTNPEASELNEECIKSISHLLDDKPWLSSPQSQSQLAMTRKDSRATILTFMQNNQNNDNNGNNQ